MAESGQRFYNEDEAEQILRLAASMSSSMGAMSRERLIETAAELGITPEAVAMAEQQFASSKSELSDRAIFDQRIRRDFYGHLASYIIVNGFLCAMNLYTGGYFWAIWPILGWGIGLAFNIVEVFFRSSDSYQEEFEKWREKRIRLHGGNNIVVDKSDFIIDKFVHQNVERGKEFGKLDVIRYLRENSNLTLVDAKEAVELYAYRNPGVID